METILTMILTLPHMQGGYGILAPKLNSRIRLAKTARRNASKSYYVCDLFWPDYDLAVEYDSDEYHTGPDRIANDSKRRNALASVGIMVITVTKKQIGHIGELEKAARLICDNMGRRLQLPANFAIKRSVLRRELFEALRNQ
jgi:very-short-patch-repair endonuclease